MTNKSLEEKVLNLIHSEEIIQLAKELIAFPTENPPANYTEISKFIHAQYIKLGLEVKVISGEPGKTNICARWQGDGSSKEVLLFTGHQDVVPAGEGWKYNPFVATIEGNNLIGRGTNDVKGTLAAQMIAVKALKEAGVNLKGSLYLFSTVDDETAGNMGLKYVINEGWEQLGWEKPTFHILGDPTNLDVFIAFKGRMWVKITLEGRSAHGGNPAAGINAIEKMTHLIEEILKYERQSHPLMGVDTINIGTIQGGEKTNIVPSQCTMTVDYRFVTPQTSEDIVQRLMTTIKGLEAIDPEFKLKEFTIFERRDPRDVAADNRFVQELKSITEEITLKPSKLGGFLSAGDAYHSLSKGIPAVVYGAGSISDAHTNKEFVPLDELVASSKILALYALRTLG